MYRSNPVLVATLREKLTGAQQQLVAQRTALISAHAALVASGASEAAAAVSAVLQPIPDPTTTALPPSPPPTASLPTVPPPTAAAAATIPGPTTAATAASVPTAELAGVTVNEDSSDRSRRDSNDQMDSQRDSLRDSPTMERAFTAPEMPPPLQMRPSPPLPAEQAAAEQWVEEDGKPKMGFTTRDAASLSMRDGTGTAFELRIGPDYKRNGKKAPSAMHVYQPVSVDVFKTKPSAVYHISQRLTLPLPPGGRPILTLTSHLSPLTLTLTFTLTLTLALALALTLTLTQPPRSPSPSPLPLPSLSPFTLTSHLSPIVPTLSLIPSPTPTLTQASARPISQGCLAAS